MMHHDFLLENPNQLSGLTQLFPHRMGEYDNVIAPLIFGLHLDISDST